MVRIYNVGEANWGYLINGGGAVWSWRGDFGQFICRHRLSFYSVEEGKIEQGCGLLTWFFFSFIFFWQKLSGVFRTFGRLLEIISPGVISTPQFRTGVVTLSFLPPLCLLLDALNVSIACEWALGGAGGALRRADLGVQRQGEGSVEWRRGSSALALLPAPVDGV